MVTTGCFPLDRLAQIVCTPIEDAQSAQRQGALPMGKLKPIVPVCPPQRPGPAVHRPPNVEECTIEVPVSALVLRDLLEAGQQPGGIYEEAMSEPDLVSELLHDAHRRDTR
jgi:hypothetical protein